MQQIGKAWIGAGALGLAVAGGYHAISDDHIFPAIPAISGKVDHDLPETPGEWRGRVDYRSLDRQLAELAARPEMAGLAVAVVEAGELRFVGTYGVADRSTGAPVTAKTVFRWASVSKTVTGTLAASLARKGMVDLERPIAGWQTSLRLPGGAESRLTLAQLLSHQTGLTKNAYDEKLEEGQGAAMLRGELASAPLQCLPGTCHTYQNVAFDAASEILGQAAKRPYADLVSERFFLPLGLASANFGMSGLTGAKDWAHPHNGSDVRTPRETYWRVPAAAGINSNIVDFARWMQAAMGERPDVLPASVLQLAQKPRVKTQRLYGGELRQANSDAGYGLGWRSFLYNGHRLVGHSGAVDGFRTTMIFEPKTRVGVVMMSNSNWGRPYRIPFAVFDSYHHRPDSRWLDIADLPDDPAR
jgi:beta-lactamase class C